jgi:hypothetical protein
VGFLRTLAWRDRGRDRWRRGASAHDAVVKVTLYKIGNLCGTYPISAKKPTCRKRYMHKPPLAKLANECEVTVFRCSSTEFIMRYAGFLPTGRRGRATEMQPNGSFERDTR